jgi:hypothetical protein
MNNMSMVMGAIFLFIHEISMINPIIRINYRKLVMPILLPMILHMWNGQIISHLPTSGDALLSSTVAINNNVGFARGNLAQARIKRDSCRFEQCIVGIISDILPGRNFDLHGFCLDLMEFWYIVHSIL